MMLRPVPGAAQYAMPVGGLFLCGAGCHPGGGVMGSAGRNAALLLHKSILGGGEVLVAPSRFSLVPSNPPGLAAPAVDVSSAALKVAQSRYVFGVD